MSYDMQQQLPAQVQKRLAETGPIHVGLIGAGKFGSMFLAQVATSPHLKLVSIADLSVDRAKQACVEVGMPEDVISEIRFLEDGLALVADPSIEVVLEATGHPLAGIRHARAAIRNGMHIVMANVEADVLAGPALAAEARRAGVVYSMAYGDQPALICELVDWARICGFNVIAAGKGTKYQPEYHASTPGDVWEKFGMTEDQARAAGMNPKMFNSFMDGTKSAIEMAAVANACGLGVPADGLKFPPVSYDDLHNVLIPAADGGVLDSAGMVEVVASAQRGANEEFDKHLRWGVYAVFEAPNDYSRACLTQYGLRTDKTGRYASLYRPYHLIGLELGVSVVNAAIRGEPTGQARDWRGDVVAVAKRDLRCGEVLDGEGGFCVWGKLLPARRSAEIAALPIGMAHGIALKDDVSQGEVLTLRHVDSAGDDEIAGLRQRMADSIDPAI